MSPRSPASRAGPGFAVYYASKAFVVSLTRALAFELKGEGVTRSARSAPARRRHASASGQASGGGRSPAGALPLDAATVAAIGNRRLSCRPDYRRAGPRQPAPRRALLAILPQTVVLPLLARVQRSRLSPASAATAFLDSGRRNLSFRHALRPLLDPHAQLSRFRKTGRRAGGQG